MVSSGKLNLRDVHTISGRYDSDKLFYDFCIYKKALKGLEEISMCHASSEHVSR